MEEVLKNFSLTKPELDEIISNLPKTEKIAMLYFYGIDGRTKLNTTKIAQILNENDIVPNCKKKDVVNYLISGYSLIKNYPRQCNSKVEKANIKETKIQSVILHNGKDEILRQFHLTENELENIILSMSKEERISFIYANGVNRNKKSFAEIAKIIGCKPNDIRKFLKQANGLIKNYSKRQNTVKDLETSPNNQVEKENVTVKQKINKMVRRPKSFYDYFSQEEIVYVNERIQYWKDKKSACYDLIVKLYVTDYNHLDSAIKLSKNEQQIWDNMLTRMKQYIKNRKEGQPQDTIKTKRPKSLYDYFSQEEIVYVNERIQYWKDKKSACYDLIVKLYGTDYNHLDTAIKLSENEQRIWSNVLTNIKKYIKDRKVEKQESSIKFLDTIDILEGQPDDYYIKNLHLFKENIPEVIKSLITKNKTNVDRILKESYLKEVMEQLTIKEQLYLRYKLLSFVDNNITEEKIASVIELTIEEIRNYEWMTSNESLNEFLKYVKKK